MKASIKNILFKAIFTWILPFALFFSILIFMNIKTININIDGKVKKVTTFKSTVKNILKENNIHIYKKDKLYTSLSSTIKNNSTIKIKRAVPISILADGKNTYLKSSEDDIQSMFNAEGINLTSEDYVEPSLDTKLCSNMNVKIVRVVTKNEKKNFEIPYNTTLKKDSSLPNTSKYTAVDGENGIKEVTYSVKYADGVEVARAKTGEAITKNPKDKVTVLGTYPVIPVSSDGTPLPYSKLINCKATAYGSLSGSRGNTYTASSMPAVRDTDGYSTIAVDPSVIPLGTRLFVQNYGFAIAADTGTAIKGNFIDVYFNSRGEINNWAVKYVNVYILK